MSVVIMLLWLLVLPVVVGGLVSAGSEKKGKNLPFRWVMGQIILWASFQLVCVPFVLSGGILATDFSRELTGDNSIFSVQTVYLFLTAVLTAVSVAMTLIRRKKQIFHVVAGTGAGEKKDKWTIVLWVVFWALLLFQMVQAVVMTYADGDDAYYVAVSSIAEESNYMYQKLAYTGGATGLDVRHGLAPFPIWIALLSKLSGIRTVTVAHVVVPLALIPMTYAIYYLIGRELGSRSLCRWSSDKLPLFLVFTELLVLFGNYSIYSVENFMIARSRQGKAALGSIIIPLAVYLFLWLLEELQEKEKVKKVQWLLLAADITAGCLCSTLGAALLCLLTALVGICAAICYRRPKILLPMAACCLPAVVYAALYLLLG